MRAFPFGGYVTLLNIAPWGPTHRVLPGENDGRLTPSPAVVHHTFERSRRVHALATGTKPDGILEGLVPEEIIGIASTLALSTRPTCGSRFGTQSSIPFALAGASGGVGLEEGLAVRAAIASGGSIIGGATERSVKTGSVSEGTNNPKDLVKDAVVGAVGSGLENGAKAIVGQGEKAPAKTLEGQLSSTQSTGRAQKIEARIEKNASKLETKQTAAAITANTASAVADKTHDRCSEGKCN